MSDQSHLRQEPQIDENDHLFLNGLDMVQYENMKMMKNNNKRTILEKLNGQPQIRLVKLRQNEANSKLGFSLRGGKLPVQPAYVIVFLDALIESGLSDSLPADWPVSHSFAASIVGCIKRSPSTSSKAWQPIN